MQSIQESARSQGNQGGNVPPSNSQYVPNPVGASSMTYLFPLKKFQGGEGLARSGLPDQLPAREFELGLNGACRGVLVQRSQRGQVPVPFHDSYCGINGTCGSLIPTGPVWHLRRHCRSDQTGDMYRTMRGQYGLDRNHNMGMILGGIDFRVWHNHLESVQNIA